MDYRFLGRIKNPTDVRKLNNDEITELCGEIRDKMITTVSKNGGHLSSNLGAVELTVALHRCFYTPDDTIVFDVGHQCYTHKLLTGRYKDFDTLRQENGMSGFMKPEESVHDPFITGHSSTSVSSAFGDCVAKEIKNGHGFSVAVIGDGALTGGMFYEALNNVRKKDKGLIVILNDNKMSISKNRGALAKHLGTIRTRKKYFEFKSGVERFLVKIPLVGHALRSVVFNLKLMLKNAVYNSNIFESLGFYYMGPVDGHNVEKLCEVFEIAKSLDRPVLIHTKTVKGKGYAPAENNPDVFHGVSGFNIHDGSLKPSSKNFSSVFGETLCKLAENDEKICAITAAMPSGTGLSMFADRFRDRFFDVGIAEEHAVTFSASLARSGLKPVFAVYSTFLQRGYDQLIHDAAIAGLPLTLAVDRAGFVGDDGETHQGLFDVAFLSNIPGVTVYAPSSFKELESTLIERLAAPVGVAAVRYPRGGESYIGTADRCFDGFSEFGASKTAVVTYGTLVSEALSAKEALEKQSVAVSVVKLSRLNPLPDEFIELLSEKSEVLFFEEGIRNGGVAERTAARLLEKGFKGKFVIKAVEGFVKQASVSAQRASFGLDEASIIKLVKEVKGIEQ